MKNSKPDLKALLQEMFQNYTDTSKARSWLEANLYRVRQLFENYTLRDLSSSLFARGIFRVQ